MSNNPMGKGLGKGLLGLVVVLGTTAPAWAQVGADKILNIRPKNVDVDLSTPGGQDIPKCKLEVVKTPTGSGYLLTDPDGKNLRKFMDTDGDGNVDTWSYYKNGAEVYRESLTKTGYSFRWMTTGMKWGTGTVDKGGRAQIDTWHMISAEEAAQEAFTALATGDFERMKALFITPQEMQSLGLPAAEVQRLTAAQQNALKQFQDVRTKLPAIARAKYSRLENAPASAFPADIIGGAKDIIKARGLILFEDENAAAKKHDFIHSRDIIQVGNAWRLTEVPSPDAVVVVDQETEKLLGQIAQLGNAPPKGAALTNWLTQYLPLAQKVADRSPKDSENIQRQIIDNLAHGIVNCETAGSASAANELGKLKNRILTENPRGALAAYANYREIWSLYQVSMEAIKNTPNLFPKVQSEFHKSLEKFVQDFPTADDSGDALVQLAMGAEFSGKDTDAKKWYTQATTNFGKTPNGIKAAGAVRRIDLVDKEFELSGDKLAGGKYAFAKGKITIVYYWASFSGATKGDFATLAQLQQVFKNLEVVTVNLDDGPNQAAAFVKNSTLVANHLHQPPADNSGGMNSPLAIQYGLFAVPHAFLIRADGTVDNNKAQIGSLEERISELQKK